MRGRGQEKQEITHRFQGRATLAGRFWIKIGSHLRISRGTMLKKAVAAMVIGVITCLSVTMPAQEPAAQNQPGQTAKIREKVQKAGAGEKSEIRVQMRDGTQLRGHVRNIAPDSFTLTDVKTNNSISISYADIKSVRGRGLSTAAKVAIVAGIGVGIVVAIVAIHGVHPLGGGW